MSEIRGFYGLLMLALIFNITMYGVFDFVNTANVAQIQNCEQLTFQYNNTDIGNDEIVQGTTSCEPEGLPWWYYAIWAIVNGGLIYAFIPFVK